MRDDRFNALKQEFDGAPEHEADALLGVADMIKAAFFLINTSGYRSEGAEILNIASDYAEYVAEARYRRKFPEDVAMCDIYNDTVDRAYRALAYSENMLEILRLWLGTLGDNERDKRNSNIATALITLLEPVIMELQEIDLLHDRYKEQHTGK